MDTSNTAEVDKQKGVSFNRNCFVVYLWMHDAHASTDRATQDLGYEDWTQILKRQAQHVSTERATQDLGYEDNICREGKHQQKSV